MLLQPAAPSSVHYGSGYSYEELSQIVDQQQQQLDRQEAIIVALRKEMEQLTAQQGVFVGFSIAQVMT